MLGTSVRYEEEEESRNLPAKPYPFHSEAGRRRLSRIWRDLGLSKELLFSTWSLGHAEALLRQRVADYMFNFLQNRVRRTKIEAQVSGLDGGGGRRRKGTECIKSQTRSLVELEYEEGLREKTRDRVVTEEGRMFQLRLKGLLPPTPPYQHIRTNPLYRLHAMNHRLGHLSRDYEEVVRSPILFQATASIRPTTTRNGHLAHDPCSTSKQLDHVRDQGLTPSRADGTASASSGFAELGPSPALVDSGDGKEEEEEVDSALDSSDPDLHSPSPASAGKDGEAGSECGGVGGCAGWAEPRAESSYCESLGVELDPVWTSPLLSTALCQHETVVRFSETEKVISVYGRKLARADIFSQELGLFLNNYFD